MKVFHLTGTYFCEAGRKTFWNNQRKRSKCGFDGRISKKSPKTHFSTLFPSKTKRLKYYVALAQHSKNGNKRVKTFL